MSASNASNQNPMLLTQRSTLARSRDERQERLEPPKNSPRAAPAHTDARKRAPTRHCHGKGIHGKSKGKHKIGSRPFQGFRR
jgi:hypothetical protein